MLAYCRCSNYRKIPSIKSTHKLSMASNTNIRTERLQRCNQWPFTDDCSRLSRLARGDSSDLKTNMANSITAMLKSKARDADTSPGALETGSLEGAESKRTKNIDRSPTDHMQSLPHNRNFLPNEVVLSEGFPIHDSSYGCRLYRHGVATYC